MTCFLVCWVVLLCGFACCVFVLCVPSSPALPVWDVLPVGSLRQTANQAWNLSLILACFKSFLIAWPTVLCSSLLPILLWFVHRLGLFSRLFTSGGIVLSRCLESTQDCSPLCTPWTYAVNKYLIHSLFIWVASGWLWQNDDNVLGELSH